MTARTPLRAGVATFARLAGWEYFPIALVGRLPFAMMIVGILTLVATVRDSVAEAGLSAACAGIGTAVCGPIIGALADRLGQRPVLLVCCVGSIITSVTLLAVVQAGASIVPIASVAFAAGGLTPQVAPFSRSRLVGIAGLAGSAVTRGRAVSMVMSYESVMDEASFVLGPMFVGLLTAFIAPWAPLATGVVLTATIVVVFALHPSAGVAHTTQSTADGPRDSAFSTRVIVLAVGMLLVGGVFGSMLSALTEFMKARGVGAQTGIVYGAMSIGAIVMAVSIAAMPRHFTLSSRWIAFAALGLAGAIVLVTASSISEVVVALLLCGSGIGAVLVTLFSLGAEAAPTGRSTTVLTTLQSTLVVGQAVATAVSGLIAEAHGSTAGFWIAVLVAGILVVVAGLYHRISDAPALANQRT
jgi:MFS family permease